MRAASPWIICLTLSVAGHCGQASAQSAKDLVGTWQHASNINTGADGKKTEPYGAKPAGIAIFTEDGHFSIINMRADLPKISANNRLQGTAEENKAVAQGAITFYGTYTVSDKKVTMKVDHSTFPNWDGTTQTRDITAFTPDEMTYQVAASGGGRSDVTYKRIK